MYNKEIHNMHSSPSTIRMIKSRWTRCIGHVFVGKPEEKRPPGRPRSRWVDNIKMDLREIVWSGMDWTDLAQKRDQRSTLVNTVVNLRIP
jgi:hypothetical protein